jgi:hypothetical protein
MSRQNNIQKGALKSSNPHALTTQGSSKKNKQKNKGTKDQEKKKEGKKSPQMRFQVPRNQIETRTRPSVPTTIVGSILRVIS